MGPARFLEVRGPVWDRIEALLDATKHGGVGALTEDELVELARVYPSVAVDVARARAYRLEPRLLRRLNSLAMRAHGLLYRREKRPLWPVIVRFFLEDYPRLARRLGRYVLLATALTGLAFASSYAAVVAEPATAYAFVPGPVDAVDGLQGLSEEDMSERFRKAPEMLLATGVTTNNISVAFSAFALGITWGVGTGYVLLYNGMMLGGLAAHFANHGLAGVFWTFVAPHGLLEILAILIAGGAGLRLGLSLALPGNVTRGASLRIGAREAAQLVLGTIPFFVVAGSVEGFVTPSHLPAAAKLTIGVGLLALALGYLLLAGHRATRGSPSRAPGPKVPSVRGVAKP